MILCLDIGNTHLFGGVFDQGKLLLQFRYPSGGPCTSDQLGIFFKMVLKENNVIPEQITKVAVCSVVPALNYSIRSAFLKYFDKEPWFLKHDSTTLLSYDIPHPHEIGADRISCAIGAIHAYPNHNIIVVDLGTATTFDVITKEHVYLGGVIIPGIYISMKSLSENTAKLSSVHIVKPDTVLGKTTSENIQSGLYYAHLGAAREIIARITDTAFGGEKTVIIGTGGFAYLFENDNLFTTLSPDLVLQGLHVAVKK